MSLTFITSAIIYAVTTCGAAIFNALSAFKYYSRKKSGQVTQGNDKSLFFITCVIFIAQVIRFGYSMGRSLYTSNPDIVAFLLIILPIVSDIFAWTGAISLLFLSQSTRKEYISYYTCRPNIISAPQTTSSSPKQIRVS
uniref:Serpentine receptor class gamma n=1 Tax=Panagrolaimus davidi TaxID=227884 RepID=A0A914QLT3_9BILA